MGGNQPTQMEEEKENRLVWWNMSLLSRTPPCEGKKYCPYPDPWERKEMSSLKKTNFVLNNVLLPFRISRLSKKRQSEQRRKPRMKEKNLIVLMAEQCQFDFQD